MIVWGHDGKARAFINDSRHRDVRLVEGQGQVKRRFTCPYQDWSFATDRQLAYLPNSVDFTGFDQENCQLHQRLLAEAIGMIWVRPEGDAPIDVAAMLAGMENGVGHYDFANYHHYDTRRIIMIPAALM